MKHDMLAKSLEAMLDFKKVSCAYGMDYNASGFAVCPFHKEKTASFYIYDGFGHCFGCGWHGGVIKFTTALFNISFFAAMDKLNKDFNCRLPIGRKAKLSEDYRAAKRYKEILAEQKEQAQQRAAQETLYWALWGEWIKCDKIISNCKPSNIDDISDEYAEAVKRIDYVDYLIDSM